MHEYGLKNQNELPLFCHSELPERSGQVAEESLDNSKRSAPIGKFDAIILGVAHNQFLNLDLKPFKNENAIVYDVKGILENVDGKL